MTTRLSAKRRIDFGSETDKEKAEGMKKGVEDIMNSMRPLKRKGTAGDDDDEKDAKKGRGRASGATKPNKKEETEAG